MCFTHDYFLSVGKLVKLPGNCLNVSIYVMVYFFYFSSDLNEFVGNRFGQFRNQFNSEFGSISIFKITFPTGRIEKTSEKLKVAF